MGLFGLGVWQSISGGTSYSTGAPTTSTLFHPLDPAGGQYGGSYGFGLYTNIRQPQEVFFTPAPEVGLDLTGNSVVRGFPSMVWSYHQLRPDYWYHLKYIYLLSGHNLAAYQYLVLLQYPDQANSNQITQVLARMDPPVHGARLASNFSSVQLKFTYIGQQVLNPGTPIVTLT